MSTHRPRAVALIPARSGSKRVSDKNIRALAGHPLLGYAISGALSSGCFDRVLVSTDSEAYSEVAIRYGAEVLALRPVEISGDTSPDIEWVADSLERLRSAGDIPELFSILRPTSPFRLGSTIRRAWDLFTKDGDADSLRAVERVSQHPGKMWIVRGSRMSPLLPLGTDTAPWHSSQMASLPPVWVQNASLEMAWTKVVADTGTIAGNSVMPFMTEGWEGLDINSELDLRIAEQLVADGLAVLPPIEDC